MRKQKNILQKRLLQSLLFLMLIFFVSACNRLNSEPPHNEVYVPTLPLRTGEYIEFSCNDSCRGHRLPVYETRVYDADYIEKYKDTLNAMFNYEWSVLSVEEIYEELDVNRLIGSFMCNKEHYPYHRRPSSIQFLQWTIQYRDGNDDVSYFTLFNRPVYRGFSRQVELHVIERIEKYFQEQFFELYLQDVPLISFANLQVFLAQLAGHNLLVADAYHEWMGITNEYRDQIRTPEGAILLSELTPANIFEIAPLTFTFRIRVAEYYGAERDNFEEHVIEQVESMIESLNQFTNHQFRGMFRLSFRGSDTAELIWYYIQGESIYADSPTLFSWCVVESYQGIFW